MYKLLIHKGSTLPDLLKKASQVNFKNALISTVGLRFSLVLAIVSFALILLYIFVLTPYQNFMYNDMGDFWKRALTHLNGNPSIEPQFLAWPPWYHILIAQVLALFQATGLNSLIRFESILVINTFVFALSVFAFHRIAVKWFSNDARFSLAASLLYAFGFPAWYFNAFLLSDNFSAPLLVIAVSLFYCQQKLRYVVAAAALFALASIVRPSIAPYGLAFVLAMLVHDRLSLKFFLRAGVFSAVFFVLVFLAMAEVSRISHGKVQGLSANGGLDFFIANSRFYRIDLNYDGWHNFVVVPALSWKPEHGFFKTSVPYYKQDYYYKLGWQFILHNPNRIIENTEHVKHLFFADMLPSRKDAPGFVIFRPVWDVLKFACFLSTFFFIWYWRNLSLDQKYLLTFMASTLAITCLVSYVYTGEPRYTYSIIFIFYLIALKVVQISLKDYSRIKYVFPRVVVLLTALWFSGKVLAFIALPSFPNHLEAQFSGETNELPGQSAFVERLYFPYVKSGALVSADNSLKLYSRGQLRLRTDFTLEGPAQNVKWDISSAWPITILMDGEQFFKMDHSDYFREVPAFNFLQPGKHSLEVLLDYSPGPGGLALNYNFIDQEKWVHRQFVGVDKGPFTFSLPEGR